MRTCRECRTLLVEIAGLKRELQELRQKFEVARQGPTIGLVVCCACNTMMAREQYCNESCRYNGVALKSRPSSSLMVKRFRYTGDEEFLPSGMYGAEA